MITQRRFTFPQLTGRDFQAARVQGQALVWSRWMACARQSDRVSVAI